MRTFDVRPSKNVTGDSSLRNDSGNIDFLEEMELAKASGNLQQPKFLREAQRQIVWLNGMQVTC